jgi:hypothetical protein
MDRDENRSRQEENGVGREMSTSKLDFRTKVLCTKFQSLYSFTRLLFYLV